MSAVDRPGPLVGSGLGAGHRRVPVFDGVDVSIEPGTVHGIIGPNGAGKSTLLLVLAALHRADAGVVSFSGDDLLSLGSRRRALVRALVPQDLGADTDFTVSQFVALGRYAHRGPLSALGADDRRAIGHALEATGTGHLADRQLRTLSGGQRQLVAIAKALAQDAAHLLLDEPLSALDPRHQLEVVEVLRRCRDDGTGVAVVLHDLSLAARLCDRITVLSRGAVRASGTPEEVLTPALLADVYGVAAVVRPDPDTMTPSVTILAPLP